MFAFNRLTIKSRLLLILLLISISSVVFIGILAYRYAQQTISERILAQLTTVRVERQRQVESYFEDMFKQIRVTAQDDSTARALTSFSQAFDVLERPDRALKEVQEKALKGHYESTFLPKLEANSITKPTLDTYLPFSAAGRYIQYHFIVANENPLGQKDLLFNPLQSSSYGAAHGRYHETYRNIQQVFGFYDIFLIDLNGNVVYSVFKETDLGSNLNTGPYRGSGLADVYKRALLEPDAGAIVMSDFSFYKPSYNAPASFIASPVYSKREGLVGVIAFQGPTDEINHIMTGSETSQDGGLGETGETYLVGQDGTLRSQSRSLLETPEAYFESLTELELEPSSLHLIRAMGSPILLQPVETTVAEAALRGESGTKEAFDFMGKRTLSSYAPLSLGGFDWGIIAEMDLDEAYAPLYNFQRILFLTIAALVLLVTIIAMLLANRFTQPIDHFIEGAEAISKGNSNEIPVNAHNEFGRLATSLNSMVKGLHKRSELEKALSNQRADLIKMLLPSKAADQLAAGKPYLERYPNATVIFANLRGMGDYSESQSPEFMLERLDAITALFDDTAAKHGIEKIKTIGADYFAMCGANVSRLDHARRSLEFAQALKEQLDFFNQQHGLNINIAIGLASGTLMAGIIGQTTIVYDVWGKAVDEAMDYLAKEAPANQIWMTEAFKAELDDSSMLEPVTSSLGEVWALDLTHE